MKNSDEPRGYEEIKASVEHFLLHGINNIEYLQSEEARANVELLYSDDIGDPNANLPLPEIKTLPMTENETAYMNAFFWR